jgi:hypothetical protein
MENIDHKYYWIRGDMFIFRPKFDKPLKNYIGLIKKSTKLIFSDYDNVDKTIFISNEQPIDNNNQMTVRSLNRFGSKFSQPLEKSFSKTINLTSIVFGHWFNQPLGDSLEQLVNLKSLEFGYCFNQPISNSLDKLINLQNLTFNHFKNFNDISLNVLTKLEYLNIEHYNKLLPSELNNLINLQTIILCYDYNQPLVDSLSNLTNLQNLIFGFTFNCLLGNSLSNLVNLQKIIFGHDFDKPLDNSLDKLINLQNITFGNNFNKPLVNSLKNLINLQILIFDKKFNQPLDDSLDNLVNLKKIVFGYNFNQQIENVLCKLANLEYLALDHKFTQSLEIPCNIKYLVLGCNNTYITNNLPSSIIELYLINDFNLPLDNLPCGIKKISFTNPNLRKCKYNIVLYEDRSKFSNSLNCLPDSVEIIELHEYYNKNILNFPGNLKSIVYKTNKPIMNSLDLKNIVSQFIK